MNGQLNQAMQNEMQGTQQADQGAQNIYNVFVKTAYLIAKKTQDGIANRLKQGDKVNALAQVSVMVVEQAMQELARLGVQVPDDVIREGGKEVMELIHTDNGLDFTEEQAEKAMAVAIDLYLSNRERDGSLDTSGMADMAQQIQQGTLPPAGQEAA